MSVTRISISSDLPVGAHPTPDLCIIGKQFVLMIQKESSFRNSKNKRGPKTDPRGTPLNTAAQLDNLSFTLTAISLFAR